MLIFSLASVVAELIAILWFFTKQTLQNISGSNAATWWQKLATDFPSLVGFFALYMSWHRNFGNVRAAGFSKWLIPNATNRLFEKIKRIVIIAVICGRMEPINNIQKFKSKTPYPITPNFLKHCALTSEFFSEYFSFKSWHWRKI